MNSNIKSFNIVLLGDCGVGAKTCLLRRYIDNSFNANQITTIGIDFKIKMVYTDFGAIKLQIWDAAGQERFRAISSTFVKGSDCIILGYDVTDRQSFEEIRKYWYNFVMKNKDGNSPLMYLVGNKIDLIKERVVSDEEGKSLANDLNMKYFGVSAKTGENVDILFDDIVNSLIKKYTIDKIDVKKREKKDNKKETKIPKKDYKIKSK
jgi:small GTP-binding protein